MYMPFLILLEIHCNIYLVYSSENFISGFKCKTLIDNKEKLTKSVPKKKDITEKISLKLHKNEHLIKIKFGYNDIGVKGVKLTTDMQKKTLGNIHSCEFHAESSCSDDSAIIGFEFVLSENRLVEAGVFIAPILSRLDNHAFEMRRKSLVDVPDQEDPQHSKINASIAMMKHIIKAYKNLKLNASY